MIIGVDLDGILASVHGPILDFHNEEYGTNFGPEDLVNYDLSLLWGCGMSEAIRRVCAFYKTSFMDQTKPISGSVEGVSKLNSNNDLIIITSRPRWLDSKTKSWLNKFFPNKFKDVIHTNQVSQEGEKKEKKSEVCLRVGAEVLIEDCLDYADDCAQENINVLLLDKSWNQSENLHKKITRVYDWKDLVDNII